MGYVRFRTKLVVSAAFVGSRTSRTLRQAAKKESTASLYVSGASMLGT